MTALTAQLAEADLVHALEPFFKQTDRTELGNGRVLLVFERTNAINEVRDEPCSSNHASQAEAQAE